MVPVVFLAVGLVARSTLVGRTSFRTPSPPVVRGLVTIEHDIKGLPEGLGLPDVAVQDDGFRATSGAKTSGSAPSFTRPVRLVRLQLGARHRSPLVSEAGASLSGPHFEDGWKQQAISGQLIR